MMPRSPEMWLKSYTPVQVSTSGATWTETFGFKNDNWYTMDWTDLEIGVYFCDSATIWGCYSEGSPLVFEGSYENPETDNENKFTTGSRASRDVELSYNSVAPASTLAYMTTLCASQGYIIMFSQASVVGKLTNGRSFGTTYLTQAVLVDCS
ncbi:hypothetical protein TL16_g07588 [Triparma laevis f. inornata]|uniref:Uncharacterized protein n=1 Tax=Triparma laevis f. inornata TaxID=1714386 RepID=A0A9W7AZQ2_9STRA|nr:hypothetical protein TL16_g07588 [Triparma laevis f. inornata]